MGRIPRMDQADLLLTRAAGQQTCAAANQLNGIALLLQSGIFVSAEGRVLRGPFRQRAVILDMCRPDANCRNRIDDSPATLRLAGWQWASAAGGGC